MKFNKVMMAAVVAFGVSSFAYAEEQGNAADPVNAVDQGSGKVQFKGSIIDAPCSIHPESIDQTIDLGQISKVALQNSGKSTPRNFTIDLENCVFVGNDAKNKVTVTFTGMESDAKNGLLGITGQGKGASLAITDGSGQTITLNKPTKAQELQNGNNTLAFSAYLQGNGAPAELVEGDFSAVANFTLAYN